jgi:hypothetical protein
LLRSHKARLRASLIRATDVDRYVAHQILRIAIDRSERLQLYVQGAQREALREAGTMLRSLARLYMLSPGLRLRA